MEICQMRFFVAMIGLSLLLPIFDAMLLPPMKPRKGVLPEGPIPQACCQVMCYPYDTCVCCFVDYDYWNGQVVVTSKGVPDWLTKNATKKP
ncbi:unnamed protein product, partial [Mesorhabditis spiculigera]